MDNIVTTLNGLSTYGGTVTTDYERYYLNPNGRYPFIELVGPHCEIEVDSESVADTMIEVAVRYYMGINDDSTAADTETSYLVRNVTDNIIKQLMIDQTRGGLAETTMVKNSGAAFEIVNESFEYFVYVIIEVQALIDASDPYLQGR